MALLAEELVEEWLRCQGYFAIRGVRLGVHEMDLLAVRHQAGRQPDRRHIEVQATMRPVSFISRVPRLARQAGRPANSAKRTPAEIAQGVAEWVQTKFRRPDKQALMQSLWPGRWSAELVFNEVKSMDEVALIREQGIDVIWLKDIVRMLAVDDLPLKSASGADYVDLVRMGFALVESEASAVNMAADADNQGKK